MRITIIREKEDPSGLQRKNAIKYWCDALGKLSFNDSNISMTEDDLPEDLKQLYKGLKEDRYYGQYHLVETKAGHGIAITVEYTDLLSTYYKDLLFEDIFDTMIADVAKLEFAEGFTNAHAYLMENSGADGHEFVVVFQEGMSVKEFEAIAERLYSACYSTIKERYVMKSTEDAQEIQSWEARIKFRLHLCSECQAMCIFNPEGICTYPLLKGEEPDMLDENGCPQCIPPQDFIITYTGVRQ